MVSLIIAELFSLGNLSKTLYLFNGQMPVALKDACKSTFIQPPPLQLSIHSSALRTKDGNDDLGIAFNLVF